MGGQYFNFMVLLKVCLVLQDTVCIHFVSKLLCYCIIL